VAHRVEVMWQPAFEAPSTRGRRAGRFHPYVPDLLVTRPLVVDQSITSQAAQVESDVRSLVSGPGARALEGLSRFLLRSEAIASSRIEGLQVSAQQVALAELADHEGAEVRGFSENAQLVANNINALRRAAGDLAAASRVTVEDVEGLQRALLPRAHHGLREVQNWVGGGEWNPLDAEFVPPPPESVSPLMDDLTQYLNGAVHAPLIQAALVHAQFETIHPFTDGNGRVGRALIHTVLTRRGLTHTAVLPVSMVLLTRSDAYVDGLTAYRYVGVPDGEEARAGVSAWLQLFLDAVAVSLDQARTFADEVSHLREEWTERHVRHRQSRGVRTRPRADSAVARLLSLLPEVPVVTARSVQRLLGVSFPAARKAVEELADAGIVSRKKVDRGTTGYLAREVFDLLTFAERRLASTRWDTRQGRPVRPVPARPSARG
jgi:Fic family protein